MNLSNFGIQKIKRINKEKGLSDRIAYKYDNMVSKYMHLYSLSIQKALNILKPEDKVLEIGCGTGIISLGIAKQVNRVVAVDLSPKMISLANKKATELSVNNINFSTYNQMENMEVRFQNY